MLVSAASRTLRRQLRALAWLTLEDVALDAVVEDGRLVARTSARQLAAHLGIDPGTAAGALRVLRDCGLLHLEREHGPTGRFGLSVYVLGPVSGLTVISPCAALPQTATPPMVNPGVDDTAALRQNSEAPCVARPDVAEPRVDGPYPDERPAPLSLQCPGQEAFEFGRASS